MDERLETLRQLLRERHEFPDYPGPAEGEVSDAEDWQAQEAWRVRWDDLDRRIRDALA